MNYWTYYWNSKMYDRLVAEFETAGEYPNMEYTGGSGFGEAGIQEGDILYVLNYRKGVLRVLGRMTVGRVMGRNVAEQDVGNIYDAEEHLQWEPGTGTPTVTDAEVPEVLIDQMRFIAIGPSEEVKPPKRNEKSGEIEAQTFRNVRHIVPDTAKILDAMLGFPRGDDSEAREIRRYVTFDVLIRSDDNKECSVVVDQLIRSEVVPPRTEILDASVPDASVCDDATALTNLIRSQIERLCDRRNYKIDPESPDLAGEVEASLEDSDDSEDS